MKRYTVIRIDSETLKMLREIKEKMEKERRRRGIKVRITYPLIIRMALENIDGRNLSSYEIKKELRDLKKRIDELSKSLTVGKKNDELVWI